MSNSRIKCVVIVSLITLFLFRVSNQEERPVVLSSGVNVASPETPSETQETQKLQKSPESQAIPESDSSHVPAASYRPLPVQWNPPDRDSPAVVSELQRRLNARSVRARATGRGSDGILRERMLLDTDGRYSKIALHREYQQGKINANSTPSHEYAFVADHLLLHVPDGREPAIRSRLAHLGWPKILPVGEDGLYRLPLQGDPMHAVDRALTTIQADPVLSAITVEPDFLLTTSEVLDSAVVAVADETGSTVLDPVTHDWIRLFPTGSESPPIYNAEVLHKQSKDMLALAPSGSRVLQFELPGYGQSYRPGILLQKFWTRTKSLLDTSSVFVQSAYNPGYPLNGSTYVRVLSGDGGLIFSHKDGLPFQVHQIDLSEYSTVFSNPKLVTFTGYRNDDTTVSKSFILDGVIDGTGPLVDFQTFTFPDTFKNLVRLEAGNPPYMMDNIVVTLEGQETPLPPDPPAPVVYEVDWNDDSSIVGQLPPVSGPYAISSINFGAPKVRASFGELTDQPLELVGSGSTSYSQIRFDLFRNAEKYEIEFDLLTLDPGKGLAMFFDCVSGMVRVDFGFSTITIMNAAGSYSYSPGDVNRVRASYTPQTSRFELSLNDIPALSTVFGSALGDVRTVRLSVSDRNATGGIAIDNLQIKAYLPEIPPESTPRLTLFPQTLLSFPGTVVGGSTKRMITLKNSGTEDLHITAITCDSSDFVLPPSAVPVIPPGGIFYYEITFRPTVTGPRTGILSIASNAEEESAELDLSGSGLGVPIASLSPTFLDARIVTGAGGTQSFVIHNTGSAPLTWRLIRVTTDDPDSPPDIRTNDPLLDMLWGLGSSQTGGVHARRAWSITQGSPSTLVAVIDTGVDVNHPDLTETVAVNADEIPGNGIDDDGNGFIDDVRGWDFVENAPGSTDPHGHGTHVAGTIAARGDNSTGVVGVAWRARILPVRFLSDSGVGYTSDAIQAIHYARIRGARLVNASWGGGGYSSLLADAIDSLLTENTGLFVAAAGNSGSNNDFKPFYPAGYSLPGVIAVAASDQEDSLAAFSNHGKQSVDVAAPGVRILSSYRSSGFAYMSGTSMAAPHISGALALLQAQNSNLSGDDYRMLLLSSVDYPGALNGWVATDGRANVWQALSRTTNPWLIPEQTLGETLPASASVISLNIDATALSPGRYESTLAFQTNDPLNPYLSLPVQLRVEPGTVYRYWNHGMFAENGLLHALSSDDWADNADPDSDGLPNLVEFLLGRSATSAENTLPLEVLYDDAGGPYVTFDVVLSAEGVEWTVESSTTLDPGSWNNTNVEITEVSRDLSLGLRRMIATLKNYEENSTRSFFRLRAGIEE